MTALFRILVLWGCILLLIQTKKENLKTFTGPVTLEYLREIDLSYTEILAQVESPDKKLVVSFAIRNEGNRNALGDILLTTRENGKSRVIQTFITSRFEFEKTLAFISNTEVKFIETLISGNLVYSEEKILNLVNPSKNITLPVLPDATEKNLNEFRTAPRWIDDHTVQFERQFSDSLGPKYPYETWQYNTQTKEYKKN